MIKIILIILTTVILTLIIWLMGAMPTEEERRISVDWQIKGSK